MGRAERRVSNTSLPLCAGEGTDAAFGSSTGEADRQSGVLRGDGAGI